MSRFEKEIATTQFAAISAGKILRSYYKNPQKIFRIVEKAGGEGPVTDGDIESHNHIVATLKKAFPSDAILSEEGEDNLERLAQKRVWCIDPLDGTKDFIKKTDEFSIHIGLIINNRCAFGLVHLPIFEKTLWGNAEIGSFIQDSKGIRKVNCSKNDIQNFTLLRSRHHFSKTDKHYSTLMNPSQTRCFGSLGGKASEMLCGNGDLFFYSSPISEWDTCAPQAIIEGGGGEVSNFLGEALLYNQKNTKHNKGILFSNKIIHKPILRILQSSSPVSPLKS